MAAVPDLDMAALFAPIPGDNPGGSRMPFMTRQKLEAARKETEPNPDDPAAPPIPKKPEWGLIIKTAADTLANTSKDLETAMRLLEALTRTAGFPGMTRGFEILKGLVENCWDYLHPIPDPQDGEGPEIRAERFNWIGDSGAGANFPYTVRLIPCLRVGDNVYSMNDRSESMENKGTVTSDDMSRATLAVPFEDIDASFQAFFALDSALTEKLGNNAPGMVGLRQTLEQIHELAKRMSSGASATEETPVATSSNGAPAAPSASGLPSGGFQVNLSGLATREEAYRLIGQVADALARIEPHSPIPDLLRRAVELGRMPFRRLIKELIHDGGNLAQVYREFGIREEDVSS